VSSEKLLNEKVCFTMTGKKRMEFVSNLRYNLWVKLVVW